MFNPVYKAAERDLMPSRDIYQIPGRQEIIERCDLQIQANQIFHPYFNKDVLSITVTHMPSRIKATCTRSSDITKNREKAIEKLAKNLAEYYEEQDTILEIRRRLDVEPKARYHHHSSHSNHLKSKSF